MNSTPRGAKANRGTFRSSISVSNKKICEDEACIGKDVNPAAETPVEPKQLDESSQKPSGTSISVGGKEACSEDACIGKK